MVVADDDVQSAIVIEVIGLGRAGVAGVLESSILPPCVHVNATCVAAEQCECDERRGGSHGVLLAVNMGLGGAQSRT